VAFCTFIAQVFVKYVCGELGEWWLVAGLRNAGLRRISRTEGRRVCLGEEVVAIWGSSDRLAVGATLAWRVGFTWAIAQRSCGSYSCNDRCGCIGGKPRAKASPERIVDKRARRHGRWCVEAQKVWLREAWGCRTSDLGVKREASSEVASNTQHHLTRCTTWKYSIIIIVAGVKAAFWCGLALPATATLATLLTMHLSKAPKSAYSQPSESKKALGKLLHEKIELRGGESKITWLFQKKL
jgi:hypothetical protein